MAYFQPIIFKLNDEMYGMNILNVSGIENGHKISRVPNSSGDIKGIINLRGDVIPVVNLKAKFGMPYDSNMDSETLIIAKTSTNIIALEVDAVEKIYNLEEADVVNMPVIAKGNGVYYLNKVAKINDKLIIMVDPDKLLSEEESVAVQKLANA